jgi:hypothetical protein
MQPLTPRPACRNCGTPAPGKYCGECGQSTALHPPTAREFLHEFIGHHVALEGRLWATLRMLLLKPGSLTVEYFAGRKQRYVNPLRLYLSVSLIVFAVGGVISPQVRVSTVDPDTGKLSPSLSHEESMQLAREGLAKLDFAPAWFKTHAGQFIDLTYEQQRERVAHGFATYSPYAFFLLVPVLALLLKLFYLNRGIYYGEHLVCALHLQTAAFIFAIAGAAVLPSTDRDVAQLVSLVYATLALHRVYGGRWWATILRVLAAGVIYLMLLSVLVMVMLAVAILV